MFGQDTVYKCRPLQQIHFLPIYKLTFYGVKSTTYFIKDIVVIKIFVKSVFTTLQGIFFPKDTE